MIPSVPFVPAIDSPGSQNARIKAAALAMEANFLAEMLKESGLGEMPEGFGGGAGEEHFASYLRDAQAMEMAKAGGIGLAETLFNAMAERLND